MLYVESITDEKIDEKSFFNVDLVEPIDFSINDCTSKQDKTLDDGNHIELHHFEIGNMIIIQKHKLIKTSDLAIIPISEIDSISLNETKKRLSSKWSAEIRHGPKTISIQLKNGKDAQLLEKFYLVQKMKSDKISDVKKITLNVDGQEKQLDFFVSSPFLQESEEILHELHHGTQNKSKNWEYVLVRSITNFRIRHSYVYIMREYFHEDDFEDDEEDLSFTHDEYDVVIASDVKTETTSSQIRIGGTDAITIGNFRVNQETHNYQGSSEGGEFGTIIFMANGKKILEWKHVFDPHGIVKIIESAKNQFKTEKPKSDVHSNDDPLTLLKKRLVNGEISKEEFLELKEFL